MTDVFGDEVEQTVSIQEYLKDVEERELEADLVLGGDDGKECTYRNGYMKRQAVFSCLTCTPDGNAGVCIACSLSCHDGHEVVELWTKRNFRCDCGNSKFGEFFCKLFANKDIENPYNLYNHNFKGLYCICNRPHPDPDVEEQQEMMQCCICEDWFHEEHLGLQSLDDLPKDGDGEPIYEDFICEGCSSICSFLTLYPTKIWTCATPDEDGASNLKGKNSLEEPHVETGVLAGEMGNCDSGSSACTSNSKADNACVLDVDLTKGSPVMGRGKPMFLSRCWRDELCRCEKCSTFYEQKCITFLLHKEDTIAEYEKTAKEKREEKLQQQEGAELNFLNKLGHAEKMEILSGIADMKNEINNFLESFDSTKPITTDDVHRVFENLAKKRRRIE